MPLDCLTEVEWKENCDIRSFSWIGAYAAFGGRVIRSSAAVRSDPSISNRGDGIFPLCTNELALYDCFARSDIEIIPSFFMFMRLSLGLWILMVAMTGSLAAADELNTTLVVWSDGSRSNLGGTKLMQYVLLLTPPEYPRVAQRSRITGTGLYEFRIAKTGKTTGVSVVHSSGNRILDQAATNAFVNWRFKPGIFRRVRVPVTWTMTPASH